MNDPIPDNQPAAADLTRIGNATRFAIACVVLGVSYLAINSCLRIPKFHRIFMDMLGENESLPLLTTLALNGRIVLLGISLCIPVVAVALLFTRNAARALYCLGVLVLISIVECIVVTHAMYSPLLTIIEKMQSPGP